VRIPLLATGEEQRREEEEEEDKAMLASAALVPFQDEKPPNGATDC
jgi:hypothetical protein